MLHPFSFFLWVWKVRVWNSNHRIQGRQKYFALNLPFWANLRWIDFPQISVLWPQERTMLVCWAYKNRLSAWWWWSIWLMILPARSFSTRTTFDLHEVCANMLCLFKLYWPIWSRKTLVTLLRQRENQFNLFNWHVGLTFTLSQGLDHASCYHKTSWMP